MKETIVAVSGYFDPIHAGHIEYFKLARELGDKLVVILNNDEQAKLKKGKSFMPLEQRKAIIEAIKYVDKVFVSIDNDKSVCKSLERVNPDIFAEGGDRFSHEVPEADTCKKLGIRMVDGVGKKIESSSNLVSKAKEN
jgi:cytidyltransferase-like protein